MTPPDEPSPRSGDSLWLTSRVHGAHRIHVVQVLVVIGLIERLPGGRQFPKVEAMLCEAAADITAFADFPVAHWKKTWSTNPRSVTGPRRTRSHSRREVPRAAGRQVDR